MKRFISRHWSMRSHYNYLPLSSSDTQLNCEKTGTRDTRCFDDTRVMDSQRDTTRRRRWFTLKRRKKHREDEAGVCDEKPSVEVLPADEPEIAVEVTPNHDSDTGISFVRQDTNRCVSTNGVEVDLQALDLPTAISKPVLQSKSREHTNTSERRFAICEELERDMIMENGMNLRKSRKNLVIRQVLHDLLLL